MVALLLEKGADPKRRDKSGVSPIENAARGRHAEALELLIAAAGPAAAEIGALLIESAIKGQTDIADLLIAKGANVDARDKSGATPLHQAALKGNLAFATLLLQHGADVNARDGDGATPLHNAALSGHREVAALLLDKGADREARDSESGATPLYHAAAWGRTALVELLIARGADVNARNKAGVTPLAAAEKNGFSETAAVLKTARRAVKPRRPSDTGLHGLIRVYQHRHEKRFPVHYRRAPPLAPAVERHPAARRPAGPAVPRLAARSVLTMPRRFARSSRITPAAACRLRTLDQFLEQVAYQGRRLARLNLPLRRGRSRFSANSTRCSIGRSRAVSRRRGSNCNWSRGWR